MLSNFGERIMFFLGIIICLVVILQVALWGMNLPTFSYKRLSLLLIICSYGIIVLFVSQDPLKVCLFNLFILFPFLGITLPPVRFGISLFDVVSIFLFCSILIVKFAKNEDIKFFQNPFAYIPLICLLPSFFTTINIYHSVFIFFKILGYYIFYVALSHSLSQSKVSASSFFFKINFLLIVSLWVVSIFIFLQAFLGIKLWFTGYHVNTISYLGQVKIKRQAGLFQDPQKAAQFIGCLITYFSVLLVRNFFSSFKLNLLIIATLFISFCAMVLTVSRISLVSAFACSLVGILVLNNWSINKRIVMSCLLMLLLVLFLSIIRFKTVLPMPFQKRLSTVESSWIGRVNIWKNSWKVFNAPSLTGVGLGNYQQFLMQKNPSLKILHHYGYYVPNQPENGYLKILYECGVIGVLGGIIFVIGILYYSYIKIFREKQAFSKSISFACLMGLSVFFLSFLTLFTVSDARNALIPILFFAFLSANVEFNS